MSRNKGLHKQRLKITDIIRITAKFLEVISPKLATLFAAKLFTTPIKHREFLKENFTWIKIATKKQSISLK